MMTRLLRLIPFGLLCLPLAGHSADMETGDNTKSKVEKFVGHSIDTIFCEPIEKKTGSPLDQETCDYLGSRSLESCWDELTSWFPNLKQPVDEYASWFEPAVLDQLRETVHRCIQGGTFLGDEDRLMHWDLLAGRAIENDEKALVEGWASAIEVAVAQHTEDREAILDVVDAFLLSDYVGVQVIRDDLVFGVVDTDGEIVTSRMHTPPDWVASMSSLGFTSVNRISSSASISRELPVVTDEHEFFVQLIFESVVDVPKCSAGFETIDCGYCIATATKDFNVAVTWVSRKLINNLTVPAANGPDQESAKGVDRSDDRLIRCIADGMEEARDL